MSFAWKWVRLRGDSEWQPGMLAAEGFCLPGVPGVMPAEDFEVGPRLEPPRIEDAALSGGGGGLTTTAGCRWCSADRIIVDRDGKQLDTCPCCSRKMTKQPTIVEPCRIGPSRDEGLRPSKPGEPEYVLHSLEELAFWQQCVIALFESRSGPMAAIVKDADAMVRARRARW